MPPKYVLIYKKLGQTPLDVIKEIQIKHKEWANLPMTYAGRLDPMAEGLLIILLGEECKNKEKYLGLDKVYEFEILFGFETDTFDLLGIVESDKKVDSDISSFVFNTDLFKQTLKSFAGKQIQKYPVYSSKNLNKDVTVETTSSHEVEIYDLKFVDNKTISKTDLEKSILDKINNMNPNSDFRQEEIKEKWIDILEKTKIENFTILKCTASVSSGTYIRQLVQDIGIKMGIPTVTYSIKRTKVGEFNLDDDSVIQ